ncbi:MAG: endonuclease domain-containing protein [bacterium]
MKQIKKRFARGLRKKATLAEEKVWLLLRDRSFMGLKFRRQHVIEGFVVDFYCPEKRLAIEIDGSIHENRMHREYDEVRQQEIEAKSVYFIRITNQEIEDNSNIVLEKIKEAISPLPVAM